MLTLEQCLNVTDLCNNSVKAWAVPKGTQSDNRVGVKDCWNGSDVSLYRAGGDRGGCRNYAFDLWYRSIVPS